MNYCFAVITRDLVEQLGLTEAQYALWIELELSQFSIVLNCPKSVSLPLPTLAGPRRHLSFRCHCSSFVDINDHNDRKLLACPLRGCNHVWCKECQQSLEPGTQHSCDGSVELDGLMKTRGWHYCPGLYERSIDLIRLGDACQAV